MWPGEISGRASRARDGTVVSTGERQPAAACSPPPLPSTSRDAAPRALRLDLAGDAADGGAAAAVLGGASLAPPTARLPLRLSLLDGTAAPQAAPLFGGFEEGGGHAGSAWAAPTPPSPLAPLDGGAASAASGSAAASPPTWLGVSAQAADETPQWAASPARAAAVTASAPSLTPVAVPTLPPPPLPPPPAPLLPPAPPAAPWWRRQPAAER